MATSRECVLEIPEKLLPLFTERRRVKAVIGGRGSAKSHTVGVGMCEKMDEEAAIILAGREYMNTIEDSVHAVLKGQIKKYNMAGFDITDKKIKHRSGGESIYRGFARNPDSIKSLEGAKYLWGEEAQTLSTNSINLMTPTIRVPGSEIWLTANPQSSKDQFSQRFIL